MSINHRLLHRMKHTAAGQIIHRDQFLAMNLAQQNDAGIDRLITHTAIMRCSQHNSAGPAIAFIAAFFCAFRFFREAQIVKQCLIGCEFLNLHHSPAPHELKPVHQLPR